MNVRVLFSTIFIGLLTVAAMAEVQDAAKPADEGSVQIVYLERTGDSPEALEASHIQTLASVLGSEEAAKKAILYSYKHTVNGFSAKLTPEQVDALSKKPGVIQIVPSQTYQLHKGTGVSSSSRLA